MKMPSFPNCRAYAIGVPTPAPTSARTPHRGAHCNTHVHDWRQGDSTRSTRMPSGRAARSCTCTVWRGAKSAVARSGRAAPGAPPATRSPASAARWSRARRCRHGELQLAVHRPRRALARQHQVVAEGAAAGREARTAHPTSPPRGSGGRAETSTAISPLASIAVRAPAVRRGGGSRRWQPRTGASASPVRAAASCARRRRGRTRSAGAANSTPPRRHALLHVQHAAGAGQRAQQQQDEPARWAPAGALAAAAVEDDGLDLSEHELAGGRLRGPASLRAPGRPVATRCVGCDAGAPQPARPICRRRQRG